MWFVVRMRLDGIGTGIGWKGPEPLVAPYPWKVGTKVGTEGLRALYCTFVLVEPALRHVASLGKSALAVSG